MNNNKILEAVIEQDDVVLFDFYLDMPDFWAVLQDSVQAIELLVHAAKCGSVSIFKRLWFISEIADSKTLFVDTINATNNSLTIREIVITSILHDQYKSVPTDILKLCATLKHFAREFKFDADSHLQAAIKSNSIDKLVFTLTYMSGDSIPAIKAQQLLCSASGTKNYVMVDFFLKDTDEQAVRFAGLHRQLEKKRNLKSPFFPAGIWEKIAVFVSEQLDLGVAMTAAQLPAEQVMEIAPLLFNYKKTSYSFCLGYNLWRKAAPKLAASAEKPKTRSSGRVRKKKRLCC